MNFQPSFTLWIKNTARLSTFPSTSFHFLGGKDIFYEWPCLARYTYWIPTLGKLRQEDHMSEHSLSYTARLCFRDKRMMLGVNAAIQKNQTQQSGLSGNGKWAGLWAQRGELRDSNLLGVRRTSKEGSTLKEEVDFLFSQDGIFVISNMIQLTTGISDKVFPHNHSKLGKLFNSWRGKSFQNHW